ncbi:MAG: type VI secretion system protein TssA [Pseudomonadales bacterium]
MTVNLEKLLQRHGDQEFSGGDLEYDPLFTDLEIAAQPGEERQVGDQIIVAEEPNYKVVSAKAIEVLERSHDLRAAIFWAEAELRLSGFLGFAKATSYIAQCLETYWNSCHPQLDVDDEDDPTMRINAISSLADDGRILRGVRNASLTNSRTFGSFSLRDIAVAEGETTAYSDMQTIPELAQISAAFQDSDQDQLRETSDSVKQAVTDVEKISATFDELTPSQGPDLSSLLKLLQKVSSKLSGALGEKLPDSLNDDQGGDEPLLPTVSGTFAGGSIASPSDVKEALDRIVPYYERYEPSSPLPLLLLRAKKLVSADFLTIVRDMAPNGVDNVNLIGGLEEDD